MNASSDTSARNAKPTDDRAHALGAALADMSKALKSKSFYPTGHPQRIESLRHAHKSTTAVMNGRELTLVVTRAGFSAIEGGEMVENIPMAQSLARELFLRRAQRLTLLGDLSLEDLGSFLSLLAVEPQKIAEEGGLEAAMARCGIMTIWANEFELAHIWAKRHAQEEPDGPPENETSLAELPVESTPESEEPAELTLEELVPLLEKETDDIRFLRLARAVATKAEELKERCLFTPLLPVMATLLRHIAAEHRSVTQKEYAAYTLEQIAGGAATDFLLLRLEDQGGKNPEEIYRVVTQLGTMIVYPIIHRLCMTEGLFARKALAAALVRIGPVATPQLVNMLQDDRWQVVRNMVTIIGEIGGNGCAVALKVPLHHQDERVRKEAIRALAKICGVEAENLVIELLADKDASTVRQAILSLGVMKSQAALEPLLDIVTGRDLFLNRLQLKKEAIQTLGRIGDKRATPVLLDILESWHWLVWNDWEELKIAAVTALGHLGDETALPVLKHRANQSNRLGMACSEAVDTLERLAAESYE